MSSVSPEPHRLRFDAVEWETLAPGWRVKRIIRGNRVVRLVEITDELEPTPCVKGHVGYVLEGRLTVAFPDHVSVFEAGDGLLIPDGEATSHTPSVAPGEAALLLLVEEVAADEAGR